jgi:mannose/fructose/N-acetylgalactosamine-specific phosphotransferase system component IIB
VDSRLVHGQILTTWVPALGVERILAADERAASDPMEQMLIRSAAGPGLAVEICKPSEVAQLLQGWSKERVLVLFRELAAVMAARDQGFAFGLLNLGNCHSGPGRSRVTDCVYLDEGEEAMVRRLQAEGIRVYCQAVPADPAVDVFCSNGGR